MVSYDEATNTLTLTVANVKKQTVMLHKYGTAMAALSDAEFTIQKVTKNDEDYVAAGDAVSMPNLGQGKYGWETTGNNAYLVDDGYYKVVETKAPTGFDQLTEAIILKVTRSEDGKTFSYAFENDSNGKATNMAGLEKGNIGVIGVQFDVLNDEHVPEISIKKTDASGKDLAGASFKIASKDGNWSADFATTDNKNFTFKGYRTDGVGSQKGSCYLITEESAPVGYVGLTTPIPVLVDVETNQYYLVSNTSHPDKKNEFNGAGVNWDELDKMVSFDSATATLTLNVKNEEYVPDVKLTKTGEDGKALAGAEFNISTVDGNWSKDMDRVDTKGTSFAYTGMRDKESRYMITEVKAPEGYILLTTAIPLVIDKEKNEYVLVTKGSEYANKFEDVSGIDWDELDKMVARIDDEQNGKTLVLTVKNNETYELPSTGGMGTYWHTILGAMFMMLAVGYAYLMMARQHAKQRI